MHIGVKKKVAKRYRPIVDLGSSVGGTTRRCVYSDQTNGYIYASSFAHVLDERQEIELFEVVSSMTRGKTRVDHFHRDSQIIFCTELATLSKLMNDTRGELEEMYA